MLFNSFGTNGLVLQYNINLVSPLSFLGTSGVIYFIFDEDPTSKQNSLKEYAAFCAVLSGDILFAYVSLIGKQDFMS